MAATTTKEEVEGWARRERRRGTSERTKKWNGQDEREKHDGLGVAVRSELLHRNVHL